MLLPYTFVFWSSIEVQQTKEPSALSVDGWIVHPWPPVPLSQCEAVEIYNVRWAHLVKDLHANQY